MQSVGGRFDSVWAKSGIIAALTLLMLWPLARVESLVNERQALQHQAEEVVSAGFGGPQILGPPILKVDTATALRHCGQSDEQQRGRMVARRPAAPRSG